MIDLSANGVAPDAKTVAAVMAAVQAYLDEEARAARPPDARRLSAWKTAPWQALRGGSYPRTASWSPSRS